jgi:hypothetical protein
LLNYAKNQIMEKATFWTLCLILLFTSSSVFSQVENINGRVIYHDNDNLPISGVKAYLHTEEGTIIDSALTDVDGYYVLENVDPGNYTVTFSTQRSSEGIELGDAYEILSYLQDEETLTPIQALAANVNGIGNISENDFNQILNDYMNLGNPFPIGQWVFETALFTIPTTSRDGGITSSRGSSSGDVNGSLVPDPKSSQIFLNNPIVNLLSDASEPIEFELSGGQNLHIGGMHLVISIPDGLEVVNVKTPVSGALINIKDNKIKVTWLDETLQGFEITESNPLLVISAKATASSPDEQSYRLILGDESHFINTAGERISGVSLILPTINLNLQEELTYSAYPNPFLDYATLDYQLPEDGHVIIALYDQSGRQVQEIENGVLAAGSHQDKIDGSSLLSGTYYYSLRYSGTSQIVKTGTILKSK